MSSVTAINLAIEVLAIEIGAKMEIQGICTGNMHHKLAPYAYDLVFFLQKPSQSLEY